MNDVFMTGGTGFVGLAILRWAARDQPNVRFTIYSRDASNQEQVRREFPQHRYILGDVRDKDRLEFAITGHDTVVHAASMKYVPLSETNVSEAIDVNVTGSRNVALAAVRSGVERVVAVSTDKASRPVNVYGTTKLLMERIFQEANGWSDTRFSLARYGNVMASTGSVVPLFRRQARQGAITLTNPEMTRFWFSVDDAIDLVAKALAEPGGTILIPRLPSATMATVARAAAEVELGEGAGQVVYKTIGQRFAEKIHEEIVSPSETMYCEWDGGEMMRLFPVTEGPRRTSTAPETLAYSSDKPDRWLDVEDFKRLILAAGH